MVRYVYGGNNYYGGNQQEVNARIGDAKVRQIVSNSSAFAALLEDGSVRVWGHTQYGGKQAEVDALDIKNAKQVVSNDQAFAAVLSDGSIKVWGASSHGGNQVHIDSW